MDKIGFAEAAKIVGLSVAHFRNCYKKMGVPYYKVGGKIRGKVWFSPREIHGWMESNAHNRPESAEE